MTQGAARFNPSRILRGMSPKAFRRAMRFFPAIRNTGVVVEHISDDWRHWRMRLPLNLKTRNYVGTHFGGTLYSSLDPHIMLAWMHILGPEFIVWDKAGSVRFRKPGKGTLHAEFTLPADEEAQVRALAPGAKLDQSYRLVWLDADGDVVAEVDKVVHFRRRDDRPS